MINGKKSSERIKEALQSIGLPWSYMLFRERTYIDEEGQEHEVKPPFLVYYGAGQEKASADNTHYWSRDIYNVEYYFEDKSETNEERIEAAILAAGFQYEKSEDVYLDDEDLFAIYYYLG